MEVIAANDYPRGQYESTRAGLLIPDTTGLVRVSVQRDQWDSRAGQGRSELVGIVDPLTRREFQLSANVDEVIRAHVWISYDGGETWDCEGLIGALGGVVLRWVGGPLNDPIREPATESTLVARVRKGRGRLLRVVIDSQIELRTKVDVEFLDAPPERETARHNSVGFVAANSNTGQNVSTLGSGNITPSGDNRLAVVNAGFLALGGPGTRTATFGGGALTATPVNYLEQSFGGVAGIVQGHLVAPATSAAQGSLSLGGTADDLFVGALAFDGVDQAGPADTPPTPAEVTGGSTISLNVPDMAADDMLVDIVWAGASTCSPNQSNTSRWNEDNGSDQVSRSATKTGEGTVTTGYSHNVSTVVVLGAYRLIAAAGGGGETVDTTEAAEFGSAFSAAVAAQGAWSDGVSADQSFAGAASALASLTSGLSAGDTFAGQASALASITEALEAGDTDGARQAAQAALTAAVQGDAQYAALAQAAAAIEAGLEAGETWAALAAAEAGITAGVSLGTSFVGETAGAQQAALSAGTEAAAQFLGAVAAFALLTEGISASDAFTASAAVSGAITEAAEFGASFVVFQGQEGAFIAPAELAEVFSGAAETVGAFASEADFADAYQAMSTALAAITIGVELGATFTATSSADVSIIGATASVRAIRASASVRAIRPKATLN